MIHSSENFIGQEYFATPTPTPPPLPPRPQRHPIKLQLGAFNCSASLLASIICTTKQYQASNQIIDIETNKRPREGRRCTMTMYFVQTTTAILLCYLSIALCTTSTTSCIQVAPNQGQTRPLDTQLDALAAGLAVDGHQPAQANNKQFSLDEQQSQGIKLEDLKHNNVHKLMSEQDLRRTFQVDSHDQVPEYEILKLTVNDDGSHLISPISDLGELTTTTSSNSDNTNYFNKNHDFKRTTSTSEAQHQQQAEQEQPDQQPQARHKRSLLSGDQSKTTNSGDINANFNVQNENYNLPQQQDAKSNSNTFKARQQRQQQQQADDQYELDKLIVMNLSTFGRDFKLRLKRNADFQQRIKDMKMFMAESTKDGRLRYTEVKSVHHHQHKHGQEPHKRAVGADEPADGQATDAEPAALPASRQQQQASAAAGAKKPPGSSSSGHAGAPARPQQHQTDQTSQLDNLWNIGSTYHDEDNLAALLIEHDRKTGQLQVDGTIGNDFVIKPMPRATIEALVLKQRQKMKTKQSSDGLVPTNSNNAIGVEALANVDLERSSATPGAVASSSPSSSPLSSPVMVAKGSNGSPAAFEAGPLMGSAVSLERAAVHMHDDDPHDDDEMFLDEDEALELAHLQASASIESNHTDHRDANLSQHQIPQSSGQQPRHLSKAASERKWKKYRKLMAQTQVPKPGALARQEQQPGGAKPAMSSSIHGAAASAAVAPPAVTSSSSQRARRHAHESRQEAHVAPLLVSHHIVYRQRPSSEGSSSEHKHSFMLAPGQQSMEEMALRFAVPAGRHSVKRRAASGPTLADQSEQQGNMIDAGSLSGASRLALATVSRLEPDQDQDQDQDQDRDQDQDQATDFASDPLGGQFYLEPGLVTGVERAGQADWSLVGAGRRPLAAPPPYALNGTSADYENAPAANGTRAANGHRQPRFKRHARPPGPGRPAGSQVRRKRQAPDTVWPEVLLVVDYDSFLLHGGDSRDVKRYFVSFWNGVDLRYKLLVHPHIRISLAGMIVAKDRDATPYLERNRLRAPNADAVDAAGALTDMGKYLYREDRLPTYDLAVVITKLDMCRRRYEGGRCNRGTAGFAYVGGACVVNKRLEKVNSVAIIEDSGGFSGIIVAAHEVGHLLGCVHDGSPPPSYLGGPGATHCPWEDGFIMSDLRHTERGFRWSQCSVEQFKHFLNGETATCLYNYPHESQMLHRLLPGTMLSLDEQCKRDRGTNACFKDARVCAQLFCFDSASGYCVSYRPAAEGSPCGEGQVCRNGKCVGEIENIIPDYTHQSQTVVARRPALVAPSAAAPNVPAHTIGRLADNGLSASSTSTATSSPDASKAAPVGANQSQAPQLTSRMDTFPVDTPVTGPCGPYSTHAGCYVSAATGPSGTSAGALVLSRQPTTTSTVSVPRHHYSQPKSAKLVVDNQGQARQQQQQQQVYQQRSGQQALVPKGQNQKRFRNINNLSQRM